MKNYECEGQLSIFDILNVEEEPKTVPKAEKAICTQKGDCEAFPIGCGGTISPCRFGGPFHWSCKHSGHTCNKEELWKVAETLDDIKCQKTCCRQCKVQQCGARCNGSTEPVVDMTYDRRDKPHKAPSWMNYERCENCLRWAKYPTNEQPPDGWGCIGWCAEHHHKTQGISYCGNWSDKNDSKQK